MKKAVVLLRFTLGLFISVNTLAQTPVSEQKMSVKDRMMKARAAKAQKKVNPTDNQAQINSASQTEKATPADYRAPIDKLQKGPNGEVVRTGERGGKYYVNKNGNKTYLSSNQ